MRTAAGRRIKRCVPAPSGSVNIDIARRAPVDKGDEISFRGEYIWNTKGGIVHWTHHDPGGRKPGGWLRIGGEQYD